MGWRWADQTPRWGEVLVGLWVALCGLDFILSSVHPKIFGKGRG